MGILSKLFGRGGNEERLFDGKAQISKDGYPICPVCKHQYNLRAKQLKRMAEGYRLVTYVCDECKKTIEL